MSERPAPGLDWGVGAGGDEGWFDTSAVAHDQRGLFFLDPGEHRPPQRQLLRSGRREQPATGKKLAIVLVGQLPCPLLVMCDSGGGIG